MKIIDAHLHIFPSDKYTDALAESVGHRNSTEHLRQAYGEIGVVHGVIMGNHSIDPDYHSYPADLFHYCVGLDSSFSERQHTPAPLEKIEANLQRENCCGIKLYPGYNRVWLTDPIFRPVYDLAARYDKPVAVHMGLTAGPGASLKYCHPLALDEAAADHPQTQFVMCHFGNPFLEAAAAVVEKNPNVAADLSGLLDGRVDLTAYFQKQRGYVSLLQTWLTAIDRWDDIMYGTDWPIVNLSEYLQFMRTIVPEEYHEKVFFANANRIYGLNL